MGKYNNTADFVGGMAATSGPSSGSGDEYRALCRLGAQNSAATVLRHFTINTGNTTIATAAHVWFV